MSKLPSYLTHDSPISSGIFYSLCYCDTINMTKMSHKFLEKYLKNYSGEWFRGLNKNDMENHFN